MEYLEISESDADQNMSETSDYREDLGKEEASKASTYKRKNEATDSETSRGSADEKRTGTTPKSTNDPPNIRRGRNRPRKH